MRWKKNEPGDYTAHCCGAHFRVFRRTGGKWLAFHVDAMGNLVQPLVGGPFTSKFAATDACERLMAAGGPGAIVTEQAGR